MRIDPMRAAALWTLVALGSCAAATSEWREPTKQALLTGPYVMLTGPDQALIGFRSAGGENATVEWTAESGQRGARSALRDDDLYRVQLTDLPRGPRIDYTVKLDGRPAGTGTFRVGLAANESKFRFALFGDTRTNHQVHRSLIEAVAKENIDFFLHTGDMVERGGKPEQWITYFQIERPLLAKAPILPSIGNHDLGNRGYYIKYFFLDRWTGGANYFVTDWGNVRLIAVDVTIVCESRCKQYRLVKAALEEAVARNKLVVMFLHNPPYSSGAHGSDLQLRGVVGALAKQYGVELVVTGHDHDYERTKPQDGTTYIVSGSAGAPIRPVHPQAFTANARTEPHYVLVDVDGDKLSIRAVNLRGEVFDSTVIPANPPGGPPVRSP